MVLQNLIRSVATVAPVPRRAVLSVTGTHASQFLNGLLASSLHDPPKPFFSAFLHAQGRVLCDVFIYTHTDPSSKQPAYLIEHDNTPTDAPSLLTLLKRYVLRSKVKIRDVSDEYDVWAAWGSPEELKWETPRSWQWAESRAVEPVWDGDREGWPWGMEERVIRDRRAVGMGKRMLVRKGDHPRETSTHELGNIDAYLLHRILRGVPEGPVDIPPSRAFPMDSNLDVMGGLDFRKGCYVGQELTVRIYHTGVVRKRILPVMIHKPDTTPTEVQLDSSIPSFPPDTDIRTSLSSSRKPTDDRPTPQPRGTGKLLSSAQGLGLALLRLEHVDGAQQGRLELDLEMGQAEEVQKQTWRVSHWWPDWWPRQPVD